MPRKKKTSLVEKTRWLKAFERGKPQSSIASENHRDIRTVKKGIEEARRGNDARLARAELLKEALRKHQDSLLEQIENVLSSLTLSGPSSQASPLVLDVNSVSSETISSRETKKANRLRRDKHFGSVMDLLRQHLRGDKLWKMLAQREQTREVHAAAINMLHGKAEELLVHKTGYPVVPPTVTAPAPFVYSSTPDLFFKEALNRAFGGKRAPIEEEITVDLAARSVKYHGLILAEVRNPKKKTKKILLDAFREIQDLLEIRRVVDTYKELEYANSKARQPLEQLLLVGLIPGQCEVCRRLGL